LRENGVVSSFRKILNNGRPPSEEEKEEGEYDTIRYGRLTCAQKLTGWPA